MVVDRRASRYRFESLAVILLVLLGTALMLRSDTFDDLSLALHDRLLPLVPEPSLDQVAVVSFHWRLQSPAERRRSYARLLKRLDEAGARAVVLDAPLDDAVRDEPEIDRLLEQAIDDSGRVFLPVRIMRNGVDAPLQEVVPYHAFARAAAGLGHADFAEAEDGLIRGLHLRAGVGEAWWPHLALALLDALEPGQLSAFPALDAKPGQGPEVRQHYRGLSFAPLKRLLRVDADALLNGDEASLTQLADRVVFVGDGQRATAALPLAGARPGSSSEALAIAFATLSEDMLIRPMDSQGTWVLTLLLALLMPLSLLRLTPRLSLLLLPLMLVSVLLLGWFLLSVPRLWLPLAPLLGSILLAYPLWAWRRLEYSLGYLRSAMASDSGQRSLDRRLLLPAPIQSLVDMVDRVLPLSGWRLVKLPDTLVTSGGERLPEHAWQGRRARQYGFVIHRERYELVLVWRDENISLALDAWVRAMVQRCAVSDLPVPTAGAIDDYLVQVGDQARRERALGSFFEATLTSLADGVVISDACGNLIYANERAVGWLGLDLEKPASRHVLQLAGRLQIGLPRRDWPALLRCAMTEGRCSVECRLEGGPELYLDILRTRAGDAPGEVLIITLRDVAELKTALRGRSQVVDLLSHDLRSPMVSLQALCEKRRQEQPGLDERRFIDEIENSTRRSLEIAEQFLQLLRADALPAEQLVLLDMLAVAEAALERASQRAAERGVRLRFDYNRGDEVWVQGNSPLLEQAVVNLLDLALRRSAEGGRVTLALQRQGQRVICQISDHAPGLDEPTRLRWQQGEGVEVALRLVHSVLERHGGALEVISDRQRGNRLSLQLPAVNPE